MLQLRDRVGFAAVQMLRWTFDRASGYGPNMSERQWLRRILFLETVAGVPGMVAGRRGRTAWDLLIYNAMHRPLQCWYLAMRRWRWPLL